MKNKAAYTSFALIAIGLAGIISNAYYTNKYSYTEPDGTLVLKETLGLPLGSLMIILGVSILLILLVRYLIGAMRSYAPFASE